MDEASYSQEGGHKGSRENAETPLAIGSGAKVAVSDPIGTIPLGSQKPLSQFQAGNTEVSATAGGSLMTPPPGRRGAPSGAFSQVLTHTFVL